MNCNFDIELLLEVVNKNVDIKLTAQNIGKPNNWSVGAICLICKCLYTFCEKKPILMFDPINR